MYRTAKPLYMMYGTAETGNRKEMNRERFLKTESIGAKVELYGTRWLTVESHVRWSPAARMITTGDSHDWNWQHAECSQ